jgi:hypothetical protein
VRVWQWIKGIFWVSDDQEQFKQAYFKGYYLGKLNADQKHRDTGYKEGYHDGQVAAYTYMVNETQRNGDVWFEDEDE